MRDKIAASKRKGLWVGGPVPLGYRSVDKKLEVVPAEATLVRKIFDTYLDLGSIGALANALTAEGLKPKPRRLANGQDIQAACYRVGPLAHLLKNRFYLGEVVYRGEICPGEHAAILDRELFEAVQQRLKEQAVERSNRRLSSPAVLAGKLFDDRDNPMTPTYASKKGIRYRYYVSHALLQGRKADAGSVPRVSAPEIEKLIVDALRVNGAVERDQSDREIVGRRLRRAVIGPDSISIRLNTLRAAEGDEHGAIEALLIPFAPPLLPRKGIAHAPARSEKLSEANRAALLSAIARAKRWAEAALKDPAFDFAALAAQEKFSERYIRLSMPLAFLSPKVVDAIADGEVPADLTPTAFSRNLPLAWVEQERRLSLGPE